MKHTISALRTSLIVFLAASLCSPAAYTSFMPVTPSPYTFGPEGRPIEDIQQEFAKPVQMVSILPNRPVQATDKYGNKVFYSPNGVMVTSIAKDGTVTLSLKGSSIERNAAGLLAKETQSKQGTNRVEVKNEHGEIIGYQELGLGNKVLREYDYQNNLTKTNTYDDFGKNIDFVLDELTQTKTIFDKTGKATHDINYEGGQIAWYHYNDKGIIDLKTDVRQNKTYFNEDGEMTYTEDMYKNVLVTYFYKANEDGRKVLDTSIDYNGNTTHYKNGKPTCEIASNGEKFREYTYNGLTLINVFDKGTNETTWYDINGKPLASTFNEYLKKEWIYSKGKLTGLWDETKSTVTAYIHGQEVQVYMVNGKPSADELQGMIDKGLIKKNYID